MKVVEYANINAENLFASNVTVSIYANTTVEYTNVSNAKEVVYAYINVESLIAFNAKVAKYVRTTIENHNAVIVVLFYTSYNYNDGAFPVL